MIISAKIIKKPRKQRDCYCYKCDGNKPILGTQVRLFGCAEIGDPPYVIYIDHAHIFYNEDIKEALNRSK